MLSEKHLAVYGKTFKLTLPCVTRWGSHVNIIQSLLETKQAMRSFVLESRPYLEEVSTSDKHPSWTTIAVLDAIEESAMWRDLEAVRDHLKPFMVTRYSRSFQFLCYHLVSWSCITCIVVTADCHTSTRV